VSVNFILLVFACSVLGTLFFLIYTIAGPESLPNDSFEPDKLLKHLWHHGDGLLPSDGPFVESALNWKTNFLLRFFSPDFLLMPPWPVAYLL